MKNRTIVTITSNCDTWAIYFDDGGAVEDPIEVSKGYVSTTNHKGIRVELEPSEPGLFVKIYDKDNVLCANFILLGSSIDILI